MTLWAIRGTLVAVLIILGLVFVSGFLQVHETTRVARPTVTGIVQKDLPQPIVTTQSNPSPKKNHPQTAEAAETLPIIQDKNQPKISALSQILHQDHSLDEVKNAAQASIDERLSKLASLRAEVTSSGSFDDQEKATLLRQIDSAGNGLTDLASKIHAAKQEDSAFNQLILDITNNFPVFSEIVPQIQGLQLVAANARVLNKGEQTIDNVQAIIIKGQSQGKNTDGLSTKLKQYADHIHHMEQLNDQAKTLFMHMDFAQSDGAANRDSGIAKLKEINTEIAVTRDLLLTQIVPVAQTINTK